MAALRVGAEGARPALVLIFVTGYRRSSEKKLLSRKSGFTHLLARTTSSCVLAGWRLFARMALRAVLRENASCRASSPLRPS